MIVRGNGGRLARPSREIHLGNNGTAMRLLAGVASLGEGPIVLTGDPRLCEATAEAPPRRPHDPRGRDPHRRGTRLSPGDHPGRRSAGRRGGPQGHRKQPVRLLAPDRRPFRRRERLTIVLEGRIPSLPYIALTVETMEAFGVKVAANGAGRYVVKSGQRYRGREYRIEGDVSSASYFFLAAALLKGRVRVENINPRTGQGDIGFLALLERLGCRVLRGENAVEITGRRAAREGR